MADNVLAAFLSAFFSTGFFFFFCGFGLTGRMDLEPVTICLEITFGLRGILISAILEGLLVIGWLVLANSERPLLINEAGAVLEKCSGIIFIEGPSPSVPSQSDAGSLINMVYT